MATRDGRQMTRALCSFHTPIRLAIARAFGRIVFRFGSLLDSK